MAFWTKKTVSKYTKSEIDAAVEAVGNLPEDIISNPMTASGDLIVGGEDGEASRLAKGTDGKVLKMVSGSPAWADDAAGMVNPMTASGDLIVGGTNGEPARLAKGTAGNLLRAGTNSPEYSDALPYLTTAPGAANTDGIKIVVLSSEPATKYNGYLYLITGA